jgi:large subunit ribosomal protein L4
MKFAVKSATGADAGTVDAPDELFGIEPNTSVMHQVVTAQLAAARSGTHSTKTRAEVRGGGAKPWRQKGTGRARQGSTRSPQFAGGGVSHGPKPRDYSQRTPKKMIAAALRCALSDRARNERIHAITEVLSGQTPSTKSAKEFLATLTDRRKVLLIIGRTDVVGAKSVGNLPGVRVIAPDQLNTYDVLDADDLVFSVEALNAFIESHAANSADDKEEVSV